MAGACEVAAGPADLADQPPRRCLGIDGRIKLSKDRPKVRVSPAQRDPVRQGRLAALVAATLPWRPVGPGFPRG